MPAKHTAAHCSITHLRTPPRHLNAEGYVSGKGVQGKPQLPETVERQVARNRIHGIGGRGEDGGEIFVVVSYQLYGNAREDSTIGLLVDWWSHKNALSVVERKF